MATSKKAVAKKKTSKSKSLATMAVYEKQMAIDAQADADRVGQDTEGNKLSFSDGAFSFQGNKMGESIEVVIINFASINEDYQHCDFDPDDLNSPRCAAAGLGDNDSLEPFEESPDVQSDDCQSCPHNEWGSAKVGKGKACRNKKRLALINSEGVTDEEVEIAYLTIPPTSLANFKDYAKKMSRKLKLPLYGVVTQISADEEDDKVLTFKTLDRITKVAAMKVIMEERDNVVEDLTAAPDFKQYHIVEAKKRRTRSKPTEKRSEKHNSHEGSSKKKTVKKKGKSKFS